MIGGYIIILPTHSSRYNIQTDLTGRSEKRNNFCSNSFFVLYYLQAPVLCVYLISHFLFLFFNTENKKYDLKFFLKISNL